MLNSYIHIANIIFSQSLSALSLCFSQSCLVLSQDLIDISCHRSDFHHAFCSVTVFNKLGKTLVVGFGSGNERSLIDRDHVKGNKQFHTRD